MFTVVWFLDSASLWGQKGSLGCLVFPSLRPFSRGAAPNISVNVRLYMRGELLGLLMFGNSEALLTNLHVRLHAHHAISQDFLN